MALSCNWGWWLTAWALVWCHGRCWSAVLLVAVGRSPLHGRFFEAHDGSLPSYAREAVDKRVAWWEHARQQCSSRLDEKRGLGNLGDSSCRIHLRRKAPKPSLSAASPVKSKPPRRSTNQGHDWCQGLWSNLTMLHYLIGRLPFRHLNKLWLLVRR